MKGIVTKEFRFGGAQRFPGDVIEITSRDARILGAVGKIRIEGDVVEKPAMKVEKVVSKAAEKPKKPKPPAEPPKPKVEPAPTPPVAPNEPPAADGEGEKPADPATSDADHTYQTRELRARD